MTAGSCSAAIALLLACGQTPPSVSGSLTVGLQTDDTTGTIKSLHVVTTVLGAPSTDDTFSASDGPLFPKEVSAKESDPQKEIEVRVEAFAGVDPALAGPPIVIRTARTHVVAGYHKLLRLRIESRCATGVPGGINGPTCTAPNQTCISGACADDGVAASGLETYASNWPDQMPDACRPANPGPPEVIVGTGQTDYLPLTDGQTVQAEKGPQGGHHVYVALRMHNLRQSGSTTTVSGTQPGTGVMIPPTAFIFTFDPDEGGYCKLYGLRYQLDNQGIDYTQFLGKPLDIQVVVKDSLGEVGTGVAHINVAPTVLGGP